MSQPPTAHSSHSNAYTHGAGSVPTLKPPTVPRPTSSGGPSGSRKKMVAGHPPVPLPDTGSKRSSGGSERLSTAASAASSSSSLNSSRDLDCKRHGQLSSLSFPASSSALNSARDPSQRSGGGASKPDSTPPSISVAGQGALSQRGGGGGDSKRSSEHSDVEGLVITGDHRDLPISARQGAAGTAGVAAGGTERSTARGAARDTGRLNPGTGFSGLMTELPSAAPSARTGAMAGSGNELTLQKGMPSSVLSSARVPAGSGAGAAPLARGPSPSGSGSHTSVAGGFSGSSSGRERREKDRTGAALPGLSGHSAASPSASKGHTIQWSDASERERAAALAAGAGAGSTAAAGVGSGSGAGVASIAGKERTTKDNKSASQSDKEMDGSTAKGAVGSGTNAAAKTKSAVSIRQSAESSAATEKRRVDRPLSSASSAAGEAGEEDASQRASRSSLASADSKSKKLAGSKSKSKKADGSSQKSSSKSARSTKKSKKLLAEQTALSELATNAADLLRERAELEARIREREEREREEQQHVEAVDEAVKLYEEASSDVHFDRERESVMAKLESAVYEAQAWDEYLSCNPLPDVSGRLTALHGFISAFREADEVNYPHLALPTALDACVYAERIIDELSRKRLATAREEEEADAVHLCRQFISLIRSIAARKLDQVTCAYLNRTDEYEESAASRAFTVVRGVDDGLGHSLSFGLWVHNSSRSDRIKRIDFSQGCQVTIELPQSLQKARTAIRVVRTGYDATPFLTHMSKMTAGAGGRTETGLSPPTSARGGQHPTLPAPTPAASSIAGAGSSTPPVDPLDPLSSETDPTSIFDFAAHPPPLLGPHGSNSHFVPVGGTLLLEQLLLPPPPRKMRGWVMRERTALEKHIVVVPYPTEEAKASGSSTATAPLRIKFTLDRHILLSPDREPLFGYWVAEGEKVPDLSLPTAPSPHEGVWKQEGIDILSFDPLTREVSLSLPTIRPLALIQPRAMDFPYRSWGVSPLLLDDDEPDFEPDADDFGSPAAHTCRLEMEGSRFRVAFEVQGLYCRLVSPSVEEAGGNEVVRACTERWSTPGVLLQQLQAIGLNLAPSDADALYCRKPLKSPLLVSTLHQHLSLLTAVFDLSSSVHNVSRSHNAATFRVRLNPKSTVLRAAASRKRILDWEARQAEAERLDLPDTGYEDFPEQMREKKSVEEQQREEEIARQVREMEEANRSPEETARLQQEEEAKRQKEQEDAARRAQLEEERKKNELSEEERYALGMEWVTVLAELIEAPADPALAAAAAQAASATPPPPVAARKHRSKLFSSAASSRPTLYEGLPSGVLLRFTLIRGSHKDGSCDPTPLPGCESHFSLRRCLLAYFQDKTPHDLTTAMSMAKPEEGEEQSGAGKGAAAQQYRFIPFEPITLHTQQTVHKMLNILRPIIFN